MKVLGLVPARAGSKGIPGKNMRELSGHPLVAYSIAAAQMSSLINRVIVSTDSEAIAITALSYGADVPFMRPVALSGDTSPDRDFVLHALAWLEEHESLPELIVHLRPTTPLRDPETIDAAVTALSQHPDATSLRSGHEAAESPFKWFLRTEDGYFEALSSTLVREDYAALPRQVVPPVYVPNGYVDVLRTACVRSSNDIHGARILAFMTAPCVEVDTPEDLGLLEYHLSVMGHPLLDALNSRTSSRSHSE